MDSRSRVLAFLLLVVAVATVAECRSVIKNSKLIHELTSQNFREEVVDPTIPIVVMFYKNDQGSKRFAVEYEAAAALAEDYASFKAMDATKEDGAAIAQMFGAQQFPALMYFNPQMVGVEGGQEGQYMKIPMGYQGPIAAEAMVKWCMMAMSSEQLYKVEDDHDLALFLSRFNMFDLPKFFLFHESGVTSPVYKLMSHKFRYRANFAVVMSNATEVVERYNVASFPALGVLSSSASEEEMEFLPDAANAGLKEIGEFVEKHAIAEEKRMEIQTLYMMEEKKIKKREDDDAKMLRALPVITAKTAKELDEFCTARKKGVCIAVFLDGLADVPSEMLSNVSKKLISRTKFTAQVVVIDGLVNYEMTSFFAIQDGLPAVVYILPTRKAFINHIGTVTEKSILAFFVEKVGKVKGTSYNPKKMPKFKESPAGGKGGDSSDEGAAAEDDEGEEL